MRSFTQYSTWFIANHGNILVMSTIVDPKLSVQTLQQRRLISRANQIVEPNRLIQIPRRTRVVDMDRRWGAYHSAYHVGVHHVEFVVAYGAPLAVVFHFYFAFECRVTVCESDFEISVIWKKSSDRSSLEIA